MNFDNLKNDVKISQILSLMLILMMVISIFAGTLSIANTASSNDIMDVPEYQDLLEAYTLPKIPSQDTTPISRSGSRAPEDIQYWATFQFDYHNTGNTSSKGPKTNATLWKFDDDGDLKGEIYSSPVCVNNVVYFTATNGYLYAVDLKTGDLNWKFYLGQSAYGTPTISNGFVYVGSGTDTQNNANKLFCINADTGAESWSLDLNGPLVGAPIVLDRPGNSDDRIYYGTLKENKITSYDYRTKSIDWTHQVTNPGLGSSDGVWGTIAYYNIQDGWILYTTNSYFGDANTDRGLVCIDANDGEPRWQFTPDIMADKLQTYSSPTIFENKVLFGMGVAGVPNEGKLYCVDIFNGEELWNFTAGDGDFGYGVTTSVVVAYDKIFFGSCDGKMYALDLNGSLLWDYTTKDPTDGIYSSPAVADQKVYFGSCDNNFYCLNIDNGSLIWQYNLDDDDKGKGTYGVASSPGIAHGRVLVGGCNGILYCFGSTGSAPPTIEISSPEDNTMVNGQVEISGVADDDIEVTQVELRFDNGDWINATNIYQWSFDWYTSYFSNGPHIIYARAHDENGFTMTNISVIVNNFEGDMLIDVTSHVDGQLVAGTTKFEGVAFHSDGTIFSVQIDIDNTSTWTNMTGYWDTANKTYDWSYEWDTTQYFDGLYLIQFRAYDGIDNSTPFELLINVSNYVEDPSLGIYPMFRSNQNRIGISGTSIPDSVKVDWKYTNTKDPYPIESSAIYYNRRIYYGANDYFVYCLDSTTGALIWNYETKNTVRSSPVIANKMLYIGSQDYNFYCLNALSGEELWKYKTNGAIDSSALIIGDSVIFGSYDNKLYSLNASDGKLQWTFETDGEIWGSPAYYDNCIYIGSLDGKMYSIWYNNGTERWNFSSDQFSERSGIYSTPAITGNKIVFGSEDNLVYCLNATSGKLIWQFETTGFVYSSAAINKGVVFISSLEEKNDGIMYALPLEDPDASGVITSLEVLWKYPTHDFDGGSSPVVSVPSGLVIFGTNAGEAGGDGKVICLDEKTGDVIWNFTTDGDIHSTPLLANNNVYIGSRDSYMYCLGLSTSGNGNGNGNGHVNITKIIVRIELSNTTVLSGHVIRDIVFTAETEYGNILPDVEFQFDFAKGYLTQGSGTNYHGHTDLNGTFITSFVAPEVEKNTYVTIWANMTIPGYEDGSGSVTILIEPRSDEDSESDKKDDSNIVKDLFKPRYIYLFIGIIILIIFVILIFILLIRAKLKLNEFELEDEGVEGKAPGRLAKTQVRQDSRVAAPPIQQTASTPMPTPMPTPTSTPTPTPGQAQDPTAPPPQAQDPTAAPPQAQDPTAAPPQAQDPTTKPIQARDPTSKSNN